MRNPTYEARDLNLDPALIADLTRACEHRDGRPISGGREIRFRCPAHQPDTHPSARWNPERAVWHCDACDAGGGSYNLADLLDVPTSRDRPRVTSAHPRLGMRDRSSERPSHLDGHADEPRPQSAPSTIRAIYSYGDDRRVVRYEPKDFRPQHRVAGVWKLGKGAADWPLYRQSDIPDDRSMDVHITEGEKDADTLAALGWCAVSPGSSSTPWRDAWTVALTGRPVVIHAHNDDPGAKRARQIASKLVGRAARVRVVDYPQLPVHGDVTDYLDDRNGDDLLARIDAAPEFHEDAAELLSGPTAIVRSLDEIAPREVTWLWPNWIPAGKLTILGGHPGEGKSTIGLDLACMLSRGGRLPDGQPAPLTNSLLLLGEDDLADTVRPRIDLHGGDPARIFAIDGVRDLDGRERFVSLADHVPILRTVIYQHHIRLLLIDPLSSFLPRTDRNAEGDVRDALTPLGKMAEETGVAILAIMHVGKATTAQRRPLQQLLGSTAFGAMARSVMMTTDLSEDRQPAARPDGLRETHKALGVIKSNVAMRPPALEWYRPLDGPIAWVGRSPLSIEDAIAGEPVMKPIDQAKDYLRGELATRARFSEDIERSASDLGISKRTLERARNELGIHPFKAPGMRNGRFILPALDGTVTMPSDVRHSPPPLSVADIGPSPSTGVIRPANAPCSPSESEDRHAAVSGGHRPDAELPTDVRQLPYIGGVADIDSSPDQDADVDNLAEWGEV